MGFRLPNAQRHLHRSGWRDLVRRQPGRHWKAITPFYHIEKGNFYGHPAALVWDKEWPEDKDPTLTYRNDLDA